MKHLLLILLLSGCAGGTGGLFPAAKPSYIYTPQISGVAQVGDNKTSPEGSKGYIADIYCTISLCYEHIIWTERNSDKPFIDEYRATLRK